MEDWGLGDLLDEGLAQVMRDNLATLSAFSGETLAPFAEEVSSLCDLQATRPEFATSRGLIARVKAYALTLKAPVLEISGVMVNQMIPDPDAHAILEYGNSWMPACHVDQRVRSAVDKALRRLASS